MSLVQYRDLLNKYDALSAFALTLVRDWTDPTASDLHGDYTDTIYRKLLLHAVSLRRLSPSMETAETPDSWDLASACAVARALIESYDALAYVAIHPASDIERGFRISLWQLHAQQRRLAMLDKAEVKGSRVEQVRRHVAELRSKVLTHPFYSSLSDDTKKKISGKESPPFHISQEKRNAASGIKHSYYRTAEMFLSQYVHTFPFALDQLRSASAGEPGALSLASSTLGFAMAFIAKAVDGMSITFPERKHEPSDNVDQIMGMWMDIAANGPKPPPAN